MGHNYYCYQANLHFIISCKPVPWRQMPLVLPGPAIIIIMRYNETTGHHDSHMHMHMAYTYLGHCRVPE